MYSTFPYFSMPASADARRGVCTFNFSFSPLFFSKVSALYQSHPFFFFFASLLGNRIGLGKRSFCENTPFLWEAPSFLATYFLFCEATTMTGTMMCNGCTLNFSLEKFAGNRGTVCGQIFLKMSQSHLFGDVLYVRVDTAINKCRKCTALSC